MPLIAHQVPFKNARTARISCWAMLYGTMVVPIWQIFELPFGGGKSHSTCLHTIVPDLNLSCFFRTDGGKFSAGSASQADSNINIIFLLFSCTTMHDFSHETSFSQLSILPHYWASVESKF
jgi:hypothetical protein